MHYINFRFRQLSYDDACYTGIFEAEDDGVFCCFRYDRQTGETVLTECSRPAEEILPLPIRWLDRRLAENGTLRETEARVCF